MVPHTVTFVDSDEGDTALDLFQFCDKDGNGPLQLLDSFNAEVLTKVLWLVARLVGL